MTHPTPSHGIPDADVPALLARAAELDVALVSHMPVARLREIALEAGVSDAALAEALAEYASRPPAQQFGEGWRGALVRNAAVLALSVVLVASVSRLASAAGDVPQILAVDVALLACAAIAHRTRAAVVRVVALGLAIAIGSDVLFTAIQGPIRGASAHFALMLASVVGVAIGALIARRGSTSMPPLVTTEMPVRAPAERASRAWWRLWYIRAYLRPAV